MPMQRNKKIENLNKLISEHESLIRNHINEIKKRYISINDKKLKQLVRTLERNIRENKDLLKGIPLKQENTLKRLNEINEKIEYTKRKIKATEESLKKETNFKEIRTKENQIEKKVLEIKKKIKEHENKINKLKQAQNKLKINKEILLKEIELNKRIKIKKIELNKIIDEFNKEFKNTKKELILKIKQLRKKYDYGTEEGYNQLKKILYEYLLPYGFNNYFLTILKLDFKKSGNLDLIKNLKLGKKQITTIYNNISDIKRKPQKSIYNQDTMKYNIVKNNRILSLLDDYNLHNSQLYELIPESEKEHIKKEFKIKDFSNQNLILVYKKIYMEDKSISENLAKLQKEKHNLDLLNESYKNRNKDHSKTKMQSKTDKQLRVSKGSYRYKLKNLETEKNEILNEIKNNNNNYKILLEKARFLAKIDKKLYDYYKQQVDFNTN